MPIDLQSIDLILLRVHSNLNLVFLFFQMRMPHFIVEKNEDRADLLRSVKERLQDDNRLAYFYLIQTFSFKREIVEIIIRTGYHQLKGVSRLL